VSFSNEEVTALTGKRVECLMQLGGVPQGTCGTVIQIQPVGGGETQTLVIDWELKDSAGGRPVRDSLTLSKVELRRFLRDVK
jgi:hypothetical protein